MSSEFFPYIETICPGYEEVVRAFQTAFSPYFPRLENDPHLAQSELDLLGHTVTRPRIDAVRRSKAKAELNRFASAVRSVGEYDTAYENRLWDELNEPRNNADELQAHDLRSLLTFIGHIKEMKLEGSLSATIDRFVTLSFRVIDQMPETGNIKWDAVYAVSGFRLFWRRHKGMEAPAKALNPAAPFASFLQDGFTFFDIDADPMSAFTRWAKERPVAHCEELLSTILPE